MSQKTPARRAEHSAKRETPIVQFPLNQDKVCQIICVNAIACVVIIKGIRSGWPKSLDVRALFRGLLVCLLAG